MTVLGECLVLLLVEYLVLRLGEYFVFLLIECLSLVFASVVVSLMLLFCRDIYLLLFAKC